MSTGKLIAWLTAILAVIAFLYFFLGVYMSPGTVGQGSVAAPSHAQDQLNAKGVRIAPPQPAASSSVTTNALKGHTFQLLISYVDLGFEPHSAKIHAGDTVRFVNNSTRDLWVAANGITGKIYPGIQDGCGSSALDSCRSLAPGAYWEFTFTEKGTWSFVNNLDKSNEGNVSVL